MAGFLPFLLASTGGLVGILGTLIASPLEMHGASIAGPLEPHGASIAAPIELRGVGTCVQQADMTAPQARRLALAAARADVVSKLPKAVSRKGGRVGSGEGRRVEFVDQLESRAVVLREEILEAGDVALPVADPLRPLREHRVEISALAVPLPPPSAAFGLVLTLDSRRFAKGHDLKIVVRAAQPCYLTVVNEAADGKVYWHVPHRFNGYRPLRLAPNSPVQIPRDGDGTSIRPEPMPGERFTDETVRAIATPDRPPLPAFGPDDSVSYLDFQAWLLEITKLGPWAEAAQEFTILDPGTFKSGWRRRAGAP